MSPPAEATKSLVALSRYLGDPHRDYVILSEGNTSARSSQETFLLKASGTSLADASEDSFVEMRTAAVLEVLDHSPADDAELTEVLTECRVGGELRPSTEAGLHALALTLGRGAYVGHTHPGAVNMIMCSSNPTALTDGAMFPDQIVVCGRNPLFVPYVDPGFPLAIEMRARLLSHIDSHGAPPKVIYLQNHGLIAIGGSPSEVMAVTAMAVKAAGIAHGALAVAGVRYLEDHNAQRIDTRDDEQYRRATLGVG